MLNRFLQLFITIIASLLAACAATELSPQARLVEISFDNTPPSGCTFKGMVVGGQGNRVSGAFTTDKNLEQGALNELRNNATAIGANYVLAKREVAKTEDTNINDYSNRNSKFSDDSIDTRQQGNINANTTEGKVSVNYIGKGYFCPNVK